MPAATATPSGAARSVAVVDSAPQVTRSYHAPTPRPVLPDPELVVPEPAPRIYESVGKRYGDDYDGPVLIDVEQTIYEPLPENTPPIELEVERLQRAEITIYEK